MRTSEGFVLLGGGAPGGGLSVPCKSRSRWVNAVAYISVSVAWLLAPSVFASQGQTPLRDALDLDRLQAEFQRICQRTSPEIVKSDIAINADADEVTLSCSGVRASIYVRSKALFTKKDYRDQLSNNQMSYRGTRISCHPVGRENGRRRFSLHAANTRRRFLIALSLDDASSSNGRGLPVNCGEGSVDLAKFLIDEVSERYK